MVTQNGSRRHYLFPLSRFLLAINMEGSGSPHLESIIQSNLQSVPPLCYPSLHGSGLPELAFLPFLPNMYMSVPASGMEHLMLNAPAATLALLLPRTLPKFLVPCFRPWELDRKWKMEPESLVIHKFRWSICHAVWGLRCSVAKLMYTQATLGGELERAVSSGSHWKLQ